MFRPNEFSKNRNKSQKYNLTLQGKKPQKSPNNFSKSSSSRKSTIIKFMHSQDNSSS